MRGQTAGIATLPGWPADDHAAAMAAYSLSFDSTPAGWPRPAGPPREFFEQMFRAEPLSASALLTGYYEPVVPGALRRSAAFGHPLYALPPGGIARTCDEIEAGDLLAGHEIVWLASAIEAFLAQVQGSVRVMLADGSSLRLGFAGRNGHPYRSIGQELIRRGDVAAADMSAAAIRAWCAANPAGVAGLLRHNPSFVMFRPLDLPEDSGPLGSLSCPLTPFRSLAIDSALVPPGAPVWVETPEFAHLCIAQDTGSAITGPGRADLFCGTGAQAGARAGAMRLSARLTVLYPA